MLQVLLLILYLAVVVQIAAEEELKQALLQHVETL
jgi:hypothetical protein